MSDMKRNTDHDNSFDKNTSGNSSAIQQSSKFDWILLVEGQHDLKFYFPIVNDAFKKLKEEKKGEFKYDMDKTLKENRTKEQDKESRHLVCKKLVRLVHAKVTDVKPKHFYGIVDKDYEETEKDIQQKKSFLIDKKILKETDGNSLEMMLIKWAKKSNHSNEFFSRIINKLDNPDCLDAIEFGKIVSFSIEAAEKIGRIRKKYPANFCYGDVKNDDFFYSIRQRKAETGENSLDFNIRKYASALLRKTAERGYKVEEYSSEALLEIAENYTGDDKYDICNGHDFVNILKQAVRHSSIGSYTKITTPLLVESFPLDWFTNCEVFKWLKFIKDLKNNEEISLTDPYKSYIIAIGGLDPKRPNHSRYRC